MPERIRLPASGMVFGLLLLLGAAALHLKITSRGIEETRRVERWTRARVPVHPQDPDLSAEHPAVVETMKAIEELRLHFSEGGSEAPRYEAAMAKLERYKVRMLYPLELAVLDESEHPLVRGAILDLLAQYREEAMRQFLAGIVADPREHEYVRGKALDHLARYRGVATFRVLRETYELEPDFPDRHRLVLAAAATRAVGVPPFLLRALEPGNPAEIRCAAAQGSADYRDRPEIRARWMEIARRDDSLPLRKLVLGVLATTRGPEVESLLRVLAEDPREPQDLRDCAHAWLER